MQGNAQLAWCLPSLSGYSSQQDLHPACHRLFVISYAAAV
jgi:hypothetical protein